MLTHRGSCHCDSISLTLQAPRSPDQCPLNTCQCTFCRKHNARTFSDPSAKCEVTINSIENLRCYRFGLSTAEVILCGNCGVYVCMVLRDREKAWTTVNAMCLDNFGEWTGPVSERMYDGESKEERTERRKARWCPTTLVRWPADE